MKFTLIRSAGMYRLAAAFTLVEVMVASCLVIIVFVSLYTGIALGFSVTDFERQNLRATQIILQRMEGLRLLNWNQVSDSELNPTTFTERYYPAAGGAAASGVTYSGRVEVSDVTLDPPATYSAFMRKVTVRLSWKSGSVTRTRTLSTYVSKYGIQNYIYWAE